MKKHLKYLFTAAFALMCSVAFTSCDDDDVVDVNEILAVKSVLPTKVMEGQQVTITGTGLDKATAIVFPGDIAVTDFATVGSGYITVVTPAGVSAEDGILTVKAGDESVTAATNITVGAPAVARVAPLDAEIKINECVEVYGTDLEFITRAWFPGADGTEIAVEADRFRRKSTSALYIYSPMGVAAGPAAIELEDCSGKRYTLPEVTLSDKVSGGSTGDGEDANWFPVWEGEATITAWESTLYIGASSFNTAGYPIEAGMRLRFVFDVIGNESHIWATDGWWGNFDLDGEGGNNAYPTKDVTTWEFLATEQMLSCFNSGDNVMIVGADSEGIVLKAVELYREYPVIWQGEQLSGWWWYLPAAELDLSQITPAAGQTIRFEFTEHDVPQTFCLCDGWWGAPFIRDGGSDPNNVAIGADENFIEFEISDGMAQTMNGAAETALIIGGEVTITKIQIMTFE